MMKKIISILLTCSVVVGLLPVMAFADDAPTEIHSTAMDFRLKRIKKALTGLGMQKQKPLP